MAFECTSFEYNTHIYKIKTILPSSLSLLTQRDLLSGVGREEEDEQGHGGEEHTGHQEVESVVQSAAPDGHNERHVQVRLLAAVVIHHVPITRDSCEREREMSEQDKEREQKA